MIVDTSSWMWPQWWVVLSYLLGILLAPILHGKKREPYNAVSALLVNFIGLIILACGGFFK